MIDIEDIKRLTLSVHDTLVVQIKHRVPEETKARCYEQVIKAIPSLRGRVLIIDDQVSLAVMQTPGGRSEVLEKTS